MSDGAEPTDDRVGFFDAPASVSLPARLDMRSVCATAEAIRASDGAVALVAEGVELVTSPGAQLLLALARSGREVSIVRPSAAFVDCLALLGVTPERLTSEGADA